MVVSVCLAFVACNESGKQTIDNSREAQVKEDFAAVESMEVKAAFDSVFCAYGNKKKVRMNACYSYKDKLQKPGKCRDRSVGTKRIAEQPFWVENITDFDYLPDVLKVDVFQDVAVVKYDALLQSAPGNGAFRLNGKGTMEFVKENGQWKIVHEHLLAGTPED